jgi:hypothetical protein
MIAWVLHILELIAGIFGVGVGISRLPDAASALAVVTPTAVGLVGLLAFVRHFLFHQSDAKRLGWESIRPEFQYEVGFCQPGLRVGGLLGVLRRVGSGRTSCCGPWLRPVSSAGGVAAHLAVRARRRSAAPLASEGLTRAGLQPPYDLSRPRGDDPSGSFSTLTRRRPLGHDTSDSVPIQTDFREFTFYALG